MPQFHQILVLMLLTYVCYNFQLDLVVIAVGPCNENRPQPSTLTPMNNVELPVNLMCLSLDCGRKLERMLPGTGKLKKK